MEKNMQIIGDKSRVLVLKKRGNYMMGRTVNYKSVLFKGGAIGEWVSVEIKECTPTHLIGELY
jgi:tRNA A37 methylthiotransferase MiaB